jgi:beta-lactamase class A
MWELEQSGPGAKRIKGLLPKGTTVAHKTGTSGTEKNGLTRATNDAGLITLPNGKHIALAVFLSESMADQEAREATIAQAAKAVWDYWDEP